MAKTKILRGFVGVVACLLVIVSVLTSTAVFYKSAINAQLGITDSANLSDDLMYFKSEFGEFDDEGMEKLVAATYAQTTAEMEEGAVLLKNDNAALPLEDTERRITIFGASSVNPVIKCASSGNTSSGDYLISMSEAFGAAGFALNGTLMSAYGGETKEMKKNLTRELDEKGAAFYTPDIKSSWANDYNDAAFIFLSRESGEGNDFSMNDAEGKSQLALHDNERELVEMVTSDPAFGKVIAILNVPTSLEVGWLDEYGVDACLWIGAPGQSGFAGMVNILTGKVNPSGHLVDTYAVNSLSAPAVVNAVTNTLEWENKSEVQAGIDVTQRAISTKLTVQQEGIYVGYRYYETRYEDCVLGRGGASSSVGSSDGQAWSYGKEVSYAFGYGMSYTTFSQTLGEVTLDADGVYTIPVTVKNTGSVAGKSVVEVYAQTPYGDYEKQHLVEKPSIYLVGFDKTDELEPSGEQTLYIKVDKYLLASYDYKNARGYVLSEGDYYFAIGSDCHDALNNVLAAKNKTVADGMDRDGDASKVYKFELGFDKDTYSESVTGYKVTNQFDDCDLNYWVDDSYKYLTRNDWNGTYPQKLTSVSAPSGLISIINGATYVKPADAPDVSSFTQGKNKSIKLVDMIGVDYDDPKWDEYIGQMTVSELGSQLIENFTTEALVSVGRPETVFGDGMDSINYAYKYGTENRLSANYTSTVTLACSWNIELYTRRGELMGDEGLWCRDVQLYSVGGDLHRTQFGGRNFEYISEDANMCGFVGTCIVKGIQSKNVNAGMKHFSLNDQETARTGISTFFNEQAFRETSLRMYELAVTKGDMHALMTGLNRLGGRYCTQSRALLTTVLRDEWGFSGTCVSDADSKTYQNVAECLDAGLDLFCCDYSSVSAKRAERLVNAGDGHLLQCLRTAVKNSHYGIANSGAMNGVSEVKAFVAWWEIVLYVAVGVIAAGTAVLLFFYIDAKYGVIEKIKGGKKSE